MSRDLKQNLIAAGFLFLVGLLYVTSLNDSLPGDSKVSVILAEALNSGKGFQDISDIREPHVNYTAPLFPVILAFYMEISSTIEDLKLVPVLCILLGIWVIYLLLKQYVKDRADRLILFALIVVNPYIFALRNEITTHALFLFLVSLSLYFFSRYEKLRSKKLIVIIAVLVALAFLTRWLGLAFFIGFALYLLIKKAFVHLGLFAGLFLLIAGPWIYYTVYLHFSSQAAFLYLTLILEPKSLEQLGLFEKLYSFAIRFARNMGGYFFRNLPAFIFGPFFHDVSLVHFSAGTAVKMFMGLPLAVMLITGFLKKARMDAVYFSWGIYMVVLGIFISPDIHYIIPMLMFLYIWAYAGLRYFITNKIVLRAVLSLVLFANIFTFFDQFTQAKSYSYATDELTEWVRNNTDQDDVFLGYKWFSTVYIYTGRKMVSLMSYEHLFTKSDYVYDDAEALLNRYEEIKYVIVYLSSSEEQYEQVKNMVLKNPEKFQLRFANQAAAVYGVVR